MGVCGVRRLIYTQPNALGPCVPPLRPVSPRPASDRPTAIDPRSFEPPKPPPPTGPILHATPSHPTRNPTHWAPARPHGRPYIIPACQQPPAPRPTTRRHVRNPRSAPRHTTPNKTRTPTARTRLVVDLVLPMTLLRPCLWLVCVRLFVLIKSCHASAVVGRRVRVLCCCCSDQTQRRLKGSATHGRPLACVKGWCAASDPSNQRSPTRPAHAERAQGGG